MPPRKKKSATPAKPGRKRVMTEYRDLKKKIEQRAAILGETIQGIESRGLVEQAAAGRWREQLEEVRSSLADPLLRIAVVGTVKSGKSTLVNALVEKDLLKRGAGIITAFITRLVVNNEPEGWVEFKAWPQILDELNATLRLIPHYYELVEEDHAFDLRASADQERLRVLLARMREEWRQHETHLDPSHMLLRGYLDGYERVRQFLGEAPQRLVFDQHSLERHQTYVGSEGQAVYLRDMELHYPVPWLGEGMELADCQGIDSPNPLHFALLQQYLLRSHFILYVVSSRSGLREADFRLLDFIRTLKMFPQTFFVLNADLDDHPHRDDLERLVERTRSELSWMVSEPRFFVFSALYHLLAQLREAASERERRHLQLWQDDSPLADYSETGFAAFRESLNQEVSGQRFRVLCGTGLSRLGMIAGSVMNTVAAQTRLLSRNREEIQQTAAGLEEKSVKLWGSLETLKNAISGLRFSLREEIDRAVDPYFDLARSPLVQNTLEAVANYPARFDGEKNLIDYRWLFQQFHRVYCEFRQTLARYLVERVNLQIIEFAKTEEMALSERIERSAGAFWTLFATALADYRRETGLFESGGCSSIDPPPGNWDIGARPVPPNFSAFVDQQAVGRGVLLMKLGLAGFTRLLNDVRSRLGKARDLLFGVGRQESMVEEAIKLLKQEAARELIQAFAEYRQRFKSDYLYRLADEETGRLLREFEVRAELAQVNLGDLLQQGEAAGTERQDLLETLTQTHQIAQAMLEELDELRSTLR